MRLKLFNLASRGSLVATSVVSDSASKINLVCYATLVDKSMYVTLINKEHGAGGRDADVTIDTGSMAYTKFETMPLTVVNGDVAAKEGVTLGGNPIRHDGSWTEHWGNSTIAPKSGPLNVKVPASSVLLVRLTGSD